MDNVEYQHVSGGVVFTAPVYLSALTINVTAKAVEAAHLQEQHHELFRKHKECHNVDKRFFVISNKQWKPYTSNLLSTMIKISF